VEPMYMPGRLRTASSPSKIVMESAPYVFGFFFWAATVGRLSLGLRAGSPMTLRWFFISLPATRSRTDSVGAFLHSYLRRVRNFSLWAAS
jgi:hypothetical protein